MAFQEALHEDFKAYARQVVDNAQAMTQAFIERGYEVVSGGTDNHLALIDLRNKGITGKQAEEALQSAEITVNKNMIPHHERPPMDPSGIRLGTPTLASRGMDVDAMDQVADLIDRARAIGHRTLIGGACTEHPASIALQKSFGFREVGVMKEVGYKFDRWLDVMHTQLML